MTKEEKTEKWKPIKDFEEYEVSNFGRVRRCNYYMNYWGKKKKFVREHILNQSEHRDGYLHVVLHKKDKYISKLVHRLVANAFIPNPYNLPQVNHKDEDKQNNFVYLRQDGSVDLKKSNLEWCTSKYNNNYGTRRERISKAQKNGILSKPVEMYDKKGCFIQDFPSVMEASRVTGICNSGITSCCNGHKHYSQCGGFQWKYKGSEKIIKNIEKTTRIYQLSKNGEQVNVFKNISEASASTGILRTSILNNLSNRSKSAGGYIWMKRQDKN